MASVAQLARAPDCGPGGRWFNSSHSPHLILEKELSNFNYDELVQRALVSVVREVLSRVSVDGLSGNHHFFVRFRTDHPLTRVPRFLKERHPEEVMIVLQHQFWNLQVSDDGFSVELSFSGIRESLFIPFSALTAFVDPSVKFALQFTPRFNDTGSSPEKPKVSVLENEESSAKSDDNIIRFDSFKRK